jgi:hypothetical protein
VTSDSEIDRLQISREIGLEWFKIHADQRLRMFNFFLLIAGFCIGGFFTSLQIRSAIAASTVAFLLGAVCICFKFLDRRTAQLLKHGEKLLSYSLLKLSEGNGDIPNIIELSDKRDGVPSYRQVFNVLFLLFGAMSIIGFAFPWFFVKSCL